jgi:hypothetical protein
MREIMYLSQDVRLTWLRCCSVSANLCSAWFLRDFCSSIWSIIADIFCSISLDTCSVTAPRPYSCRFEGARSLHVCLPSQSIRDARFPNAPSLSEASDSHLYTLGEYSATLAFPSSTLVRPAVRLEVTLEGSSLDARWAFLVSLV